MKYTGAPKEIILEGEDSLFLGGGITGCHNWQRSVTDALKESRLHIINPRRENWNMDSDDSENQIQWEFDAMNAATAIMFWFAGETYCPITLFEYGKWINEEKRLFVGCDPGYARIKDVQIQTKIHRPSQKVHTSLNSLLAEIFEWHRR